ncbi:MAG: hypothetical protein WCE93_06205 [Nitrososphaeraceae archaeon]
MYKIKKLRKRFVSYVVLAIIGLDEFVMFSGPVIFPPIVALDMLVMLDPVSCPIIDCAFAELTPMAAISETTATRTGRIKTSCLLIINSLRPSVIKGELES